MTLVEIAQIYTDLVRLEREVPEQEYQAKDRINALRTKYHEALMSEMREEGIDFSDRFDAMSKAFELVKGAGGITRGAGLTNKTIKRKRRIREKPYHAGSSGRSVKRRA